MKTEGNLANPSLVVGHSRQVLEPIRRYGTSYWKRSEQITVPVPWGSDWGHFAGNSTLKGRKGSKKPLSVFRASASNSSHKKRKKNFFVVFWHENIGKLDISKSKGIERYSFSPSISKQYYNSKFLSFYSYIAMGDVQGYHIRRPKAIQPVCLPLIFPLMYSSAPSIPPESFCH